MDTQLTVRDPRFRDMMERLKMLVANGQKFTDAQAEALAQFAVTEELDPFIGECYLLTDNSGKVLGPVAGIAGARRKAREQIGDDETYFTDFVDLNPPDAGILYAIECRLRDTKTLKKYLALRIQAENMARANGSPDPAGEAIEIVGTAPVWRGTGYFLKAEANEYKDRKYHPREKAKKRAEAAALKARFGLRYMVGANGSTSIIEELPDATITAMNEVIPGQFTEAPQMIQEVTEPAIDIEYPEQLQTWVNKEDERYIDMTTERLLDIEVKLHDLANTWQGLTEDQKAELNARSQAIREIRDLRNGR